MQADARAVLLRGINVGGNNLVPMQTLRTFLEAAGLKEVRTLLQSGNAVGRGGPADPLAFERRLERDAEDHLGVRVDFHVRSGRELQALVDENPLPGIAKDDPSRFIVFFLKQPVHPTKVRALRALIKGPETLEAVGRHLYVVYPDGMGRSKLTSTLVERALEVRGTARNWNTVLKLTALASTLAPGR